MSINIYVYRFDLHLKIVEISWLHFYVHHCIYIFLVRVWYSFAFLVSTTRLVATQMTSVLLLTREHRVPVSPCSLRRSNDLLSFVGGSFVVIGKRRRFSGYCKHNIATHRQPRVFVLMFMHTLRVNRCFEGLKDACGTKHKITTSSTHL